MSFWIWVEQLLDFNKVRRFQEACGLTPNVDIVKKKRENNVEYNSSQTFMNGKCINCASNLQEQAPVNNYMVKNWFLYYLFRFGSFLGTEEFYITFIPLVFWNFDPYVGRKLVVVWVVTM